MRALVAEHGTSNWTCIAQALPERSGKQCRERYHNHLDDKIKKGEWTEHEDRIIIVLQREIGNQWAKITKMLPGRTDNAVKNRFHASERAKSRGKLNDDFLHDAAFTSHIVNEAKRVNGEVDDDSATVYTDVGSVSTNGQSQCDHRQQEMQIKLESRIKQEPIFNQHVESHPNYQISYPVDAHSYDHNNNSSEEWIDDLMEIDIISFEDPDAEDEFPWENEMDVDKSDKKCMEIDTKCLNFDFMSKSFSDANVEEKPTGFCSFDSWRPHRSQPAVPVSDPQTQHYFSQQQCAPQFSFYAQHALPHVHHQSPYGTIPQAPNGGLQGEYLHCVPPQDQVHYQYHHQHNVYQSQYQL